MLFYYLCTIDFNVNHRDGDYNKIVHRTCCMRSNQLHNSRVAGRAAQCARAGFWYNVISNFVMKSHGSIVKAITSFARSLPPIWSLSCCCISMYFFSYLGIWITIISLGYGFAHPFPLTSAYAFIYMFDLDNSVDSSFKPPFAFQFPFIYLRFYFYRRKKSANIFCEST